MVNKKVLAIIMVTVLMFTCTVTISALNMPDTTLISVSGGWSDIPVLPAQIINNTITRKFNIRDNTLTYTTAHTVTNYIALAFSKNNLTSFDDYIYFQFHITCTPLSGNPMSGQTEPYAILYSENMLSGPSENMTLNVAEVDDVNIMVESIIAGTNIRRITVGVNCNYYKFNKTLGILVSMPLVQSAVVGIAFNNIIVENGDPLPNADRVLQNINNQVNEINNNLHDINDNIDTTNQNIIELCGLTEENTSVLEQQNELIRYYAENQDSLEKTWLTNQLDNLYINNTLADQLHLIPTTTNFNQLFTYLKDIFIHSHETKVIDVPKIKIPLLYNNGTAQLPSINDGIIITSGNNYKVDLSSILNKPIVKTITNFSKGMYTLFFVYWIFHFISKILNLLTFKSPKLEKMEYDKTQITSNDNKHDKNRRFK